MGDVINLAQHRATRRRPSGGSGGERAEFYFDLACPTTYLAAERVERHFGQVTWTPVTGAALLRGARAVGDSGSFDLRAFAEARAAQLRLPLTWPAHFPAPVPAAMRAAAYAAEEGRGTPFVLAATRLAFCGGFDLDDPEILAEAAAAAGIGLDACLQAAGDAGRDAVAEHGARRLLAAGIERLPVLGVGGELFAGEERLGEAAAAARSGPAAEALVR
jgi:2-hydroxychromene-2-carboxylate isomerase